MVYSWLLIGIKEPIITRSTVLLQKLTIPPLAEKFPAFYKARKFITVLTTYRARWIQSTPSHPLSLWPHLSLRLPSCLLPSRPTKTPYTFLLFPMRATWSALLIVLNWITIIRERFSSTDLQNQSRLACSHMHVHSGIIESPVLKENKSWNATLSNVLCELKKVKNKSNFRQEWPYAAFDK